MKPILLTSMLALAIISCEKEPQPTCDDGVQNQEEVYTDCGGPCNPCPISYPENGNLGTNLLFGDQDTLDLVSSNYSFKADVPTGSSLKIIATTISGDFWLYGTNNGWNISPLTNSQSFEVMSAGTANMTINLSGSSGSASLDYLENGNQVTKTKIIVWG